jgi:Na+/H+ antiporter NhaD/arsenite permease-like protein
MDVAVVSLIALLVAIVISSFASVNVGTLCLGLALVVGAYFGGLDIASIIKGYPSNLFILLAGTTYLFAIAQTNGTLDQIAKMAIRLVRGRVALLPISFFVIAFLMSSIGPGHITSAALLAPASMLLADRAGISPLLMALVVGNGSQAGAMSPIAPPGIISSTLLAKEGLVGVELQLWSSMLVVCFSVSALAYFLFGGLKLWREGNAVALGPLPGATPEADAERFTGAQLATLLAIGALIAVAVLAQFYKFPFDIGLGAFLIGAILTLFRAAEEGKAIKAMPWSTILMVTGVSVLVNLMSDVGGMDLFAKLIASMSTPGTVTLVAGFWAGLVSVYASTVGVILPAFLPMAPRLLEQLGSTDGAALLPLVSSMIICGFVVDLSPLSTTGAIFISNAGPNADKAALFRNMLLWGLSMSVVGALTSWIVFSVL